MDGELSGFETFFDEVEDFAFAFVEVVGWLDVIAGGGGVMTDVGRWRVVEQGTLVLGAEGGGESCCWC